MHIQNLCHHLWAKYESQSYLLPDSLSIKEEAMHIQLPLSTKKEIASKLQGIEVDTIMEGKSCFY